MYWNLPEYYGTFADYEININMRCIEIGIFYNYHSLVELININMRCIEMEVSENNNIEDARLTLTWDVLKFQKS